MKTPAVPAPVPPPTWRRSVTRALVLGTIFLWIAWDIYAAIEPTPGDTESEWIRDFSWTHPTFPLAVGAVMGHFFFNRDARRVPGGAWWLIGLAIPSLFLDVMGWLPLLLPGIWFLAGALLGGIFWPQRTKHSEASPWA